MGYTFAEKALARGAGLDLVQAGQVVDVEPDVVLSHDNTAAIIDVFRAIGAERIKRPGSHVIILDHTCPPPTTKHVDNHKSIREFVAEQEEGDGDKPA